MSSLRDIRSHLRSIENIKKITDAMERVAAARLRRAQAQAEQSRPYISKLKQIVEQLASEFNHPLFKQREIKKTGLIVITADKGLSGSYNTSVLLAADQFLKKYTQDNIELILFGRKALDHYQRKKWPVRHQTVEWGGKISVHEIKLLSDHLVKWFLTGEFDEIWLIYTHYITIMNKKIVVEKFLNIEKPPAEKAGMDPNYIFEPDPEEILAGILPRYCGTRIQTALYEAYASELAARIMAMRSASKNSEDLISRLTLVRNKIRQGAITKEMIEISAGAEAFK